MYFSYPQSTLNKSLQVSQHWDSYHNIPVSLPPSFKNETNYIVNNKYKTTNFKQTNYNINIAEKYVNNKIYTAPLLSSTSVNTIKVLSYNLYNEGMQKDQILTNNKKIIQNYLPLDFIGLQEATNYDKLDIKMKSIQTTSENNPIALLWDDSKYNLVAYHSDNFIPGRPILGARFTYKIFDSPIFVITLHAQHNIQNDKIYTDSILKILSKLDFNPKYRLIILGDFNKNITSLTLYPYLTLYDTHFVKQTTTATCCDTEGITFNYKADHILDSYPPIFAPKSKVNKNYIPSSDHLPLFSILHPMQKF